MQCACATIQEALTSSFAALSLLVTNVSETFRTSKSKTMASRAPVASSSSSSESDLGSTSLQTVRPHSPAVESMDDDRTNIPETEDFGSHKPSAREAMETPSCKPILIPIGLIRLVAVHRSTIYQIRSGLSYHATGHHGNWYSTGGGAFSFCTGGRPGA